MSLSSLELMHVPGGALAALLQSPDEHSLGKLVIPNLRRAEHMIRDQ